MKKIKVSKKLVDDLTELRCSILDDEGREINNPRPLALDVTPTKVSVQDEIRRMLRQELSRQAQEQGAETFEEANDFDVKDDFETENEMTKYELIEEEYPEDDRYADIMPEVDGENKKGDRVPEDLEANVQVQEREGKVLEKEREGSIVST